jgi:hypothetical protein
MSKEKNMIYLFMAMFVSIGWSHDEAHAHTILTESLSVPTHVEATIQQVVEGIIKDKSIDIGITALTMKEDSTSSFQMKGAAGSNSTIADLIEALKQEPRTSKVYLVSTEKSAVNGTQRQVFVMDAAFAAR